MHAPSMRLMVCTLALVCAASCVSAQPTTGHEGMRSRVLFQADPTPDIAPGLGLMPYREPYVPKNPGGAPVYGPYGGAPAEEKLPSMQAPAKPVAPAYGGAKDTPPSTQPAKPDAKPAAPAYGGAKEMPPSTQPAKPDAKPAASAYGGAKEMPPSTQPAKPDAKPAAPAYGGSKESMEDDKGSTGGTEKPPVKQPYVPTAADITAASRVVCPKAGFDSVANFSVEAYIAKSWYPQAQVPLVYQQPSQLYCVKATYKPIDPKDPAAGLKVYNYGNERRVNGPTMGTTTADASRNYLLALPASPDTLLEQQIKKSRETWGSRLGSDPNANASKLEVGPPALVRSRARTFGPYWIVAVGVADPPEGDAKSRAASDIPEYKWAVVSGGWPRWESNGACSTFVPGIPPRAQYNGGLWLFARSPVDPVAAAEARAAAEALGLDVSQLVDVKQEGCTYEGSVDV
ncbi:hypothetical protein FOA52_014122 [Chlamydomonas sp. UWO 241]|nr:hypothetical protein FOA52_014122 [Chlamydomonas sp. UWO 241]